MAAAADIYLDDFLLFDVSKPISDTSYFEIEKSTLQWNTHTDGRRAAPSTRTSSTS